MTGWLVDDDEVAEVVQALQGGPGGRNVRMSAAVFGTSTYSMTVPSRSKKTAGRGADGRSENDCERSSIVRRLRLLDGFPFPLVHAELRMEAMRCHTTAWRASVWASRSRIHDRHDDRRIRELCGMSRRGRRCDDTRALRFRVFSACTRFMLDVLLDAPAATENIITRHACVTGSPRATARRWISNPSSFVRAVSSERYRPGYTLRSRPVSGNRRPRADGVSGAAADPEDKEPPVMVANVLEDRDGLVDGLPGRCAGRPPPLPPYRK